MEADSDMNGEAQSVGLKQPGGLKGKAEGEVGALPPAVDRNHKELFPAWSAKEMQNFGTSFFKHAPPLLSLSPEIGFSLKTKNELIVNMKRPLNWDIDPNPSDNNLALTPQIKYGLKRNGPSKVLHRTKKSLGWEPLEKSDSTEKWRHFTEEEVRPSQWLSLGNQGNGGTGGKNSKPSEYSQVTCYTTLTLGRMLDIINGCQDWFLKLNITQTLT